MRVASELGILDPIYYLALLTVFIFIVCFEGRESLDALELNS